MKKGNRIFLLISIAIGLFSASFGLFLYMWSPPFFREVDLRYSDFRFKIRGNLKPNPHVAIVAIDERSINELGRWPWSRRIIAELVEKLDEYDPKIIAFDIVFSERDSEDSDKALGMSLKKRGNSVLGYFFRNDSTNEPHPKSLEQIKRSNIKLIRSISEPKGKFLSEFRSGDLNLPEIGDHAKGFGFFNMLPDDDGIYRRAQLLIQYNNEIYPSLNLESIRRYFQGEILLSVATYGVEGLNVKQLEIPTDERGQFLLNYYGAGGLIPTYSVLDVLSGKVARDALKGKVVFIGATEIGIYDVRPTPFDPIFSGVEIHATIAGNILDGRFLIQNNVTKGLDIVLILLMPLILVLLLMRVGGTLSGLFIFLALIFISLLGNYLLFVRSNLILSALYPGLSLGFAYVLFEG
ncbi:MAG: CHASE2 domain-containing protein, partial [Thermodesulfobacteriota bacterium]